MNIATWGWGLGVGAGGRVRQPVYPSSTCNMCQHDSNPQPPTPRGNGVGIVLCLACVAMMSAADSVGPQQPLPRAVPLAPAQQDPSAMSEEDRLLRGLDRAQRSREERIQTILRAASGVRPVDASELGAGLDRPRAERDKAMGELRTALNEWLGRTHRTDRDVLDQASATRQAAQVSPLSAENRVAIAECLHDLAQEEQGAEREKRLVEGLAEVSALPPELAEPLRPRAAWLNVFFLAELARLPGDAATRADQATRARAAAEAFPGTYPNSELAPVVAILVADLPKGAP
jgi:hypothetical protein